MHILRATDYRVMPWKNGGGTTTEIAVSPEGAALDDFDWRVSMARVEQDGPFSAFPGIDRTLSILEGEGVILNVSDRIPFGLTKASEPLPFPADVPTRANLIAGPIVDLNVMSRRARMVHSVERMTIAGTVELAIAAETMLVFCHRGRVRADGLETVVLDALDALRIDRGGPVLRLSADDRATVFVILINAVGGND